ncbi:MAG: four helix bundle protein [Rickettsiales bacterium]|jgi:four helix bundle protein|nr:four helix bundle protein [Rickettsiales bacterium]
MHDIKKLKVYDKAYKLALDIYKSTELFPKSELFGLVSQMRRSVVSINSNLMEGGSRKTDGEFRQFIGIACGSVSELEFQIRLSSDLGFIDKDISLNMVKEILEIKNMLFALDKSLT